MSQSRRRRASAPSSNSGKESALESPAKPPLGALALLRSNVPKSEVIKIFSPQGELPSFIGSSHPAVRAAMGAKPLRRVASPCQQHGQKQEVLFRAVPSMQPQPNDNNWTYELLQDGSLKLSQEQGIPDKPNMDALHKAVLDLNSRLQQLRASIVSNRKALEEAEDKGEVGDVGALYLEQKRLTRELDKLESSGSVNYQAPLRQVDVILQPNVPAFVLLLDSVLTWCPPAPEQVTESYVPHEGLVEKVVVE